jgi:hypothetical protein
MAKIVTGNPPHDAALLRAEHDHQVALAGMPSQATAKTADLAYARACLASCKANNGGFGATLFLGMLKELGVNS